MAEEEYEELKEIADEENGAIYLLVGDSDSNYCDIGHNRNYDIDLEDIYVGKAVDQDWLSRINQPHIDIHERVENWRQDNWYYTFVFTPTGRKKWKDLDANYLEYMFYWVGEIEGNFNLINNISPSIGDPEKLTSERKKELNAFLVRAAGWLKCHDCPLLKR